MEKIINFDGHGFNDLQRGTYAPRLLTLSEHGKNMDRREGIGKQIETAINYHAELVKIASAYRNLLRTFANTEGEVATFQHIEKVLQEIKEAL